MPIADADADAACDPTTVMATDAGATEQPLDTASDDAPLDPPLKAAAIDTATSSSSDLFTSTLCGLATLAGAMVGAVECRLTKAAAAA